MVIGILHTVFIDSYYNTSVYSMYIHSFIEYRI